ncbi:hypothetical protein BGW80DRAFT_559395 [Lactifluus volemus]|nr:hypothetical protein BGW80DRAFT_559395 [Lactifluus volemus]
MDQDPHFLQDLTAASTSALLVSSQTTSISPPITPFDSFDLRPSSPHFAHTPSYNASYQNPYYVESELDFESKDDILGLSDPLLIPPDDEYDPSKYDAPFSTNLMLFEDFMSGSNRMSDSVTPADDAHPLYYDQGSPSSSNGGAEIEAENDDRRVPATSVSSHLGVNADPHLDFNQLRVESPYRPPVQIPASPQLTSQSRPVLVTPDLTQPSAYSQ